MQSPLKVTGVLLLFVIADRLRAQEDATTLAPDARRLAAMAADAGQDSAPAAVLSPAQWRRVDAAVDRALDWLAAQQQPDGSFPTLAMGQPGVTSLCLMAFMAQGHNPGEGPYGKTLDRAVDYILRCQKENGLVTLLGPEGPRIRRTLERKIANCAAYNHAISSLTLSELYGMGGGGRAQRIETAIDKALAATLEMQRWPKDRTEDRGGWRYLDNYDRHDSDLSVTGWELMFLRSARNAGFDVPKQPIDDAVAYVRRCFSPEYGVFEYANGGPDDRSRAMAGAGILAMAHAGYNDLPEAQQSGQWLLQHHFNEYNVLVDFNQGWIHDRYHYSLFNSCQGMYQLGGRGWKEFFPPTVRTLLANQQADGSWPAESHFNDAQFGNAYTTALVILSLGAPNQLLPIFQR